jgi:curli biogenesis system outer membrane secretion channel CsgG
MINLLQKTLLYLTLLAFGLALGFPLQAQKEGRKKRIAVLMFDDRSSSNFRWGRYKTAGEGVMEMVITELVKTGNYMVMERSQIDAIIQEQGFQQSGMVTEETAVAVGKLLGVELAVFGAVTEFGYSRNRKNVRVPGVNVKVGNNKATVALDLRIVSITTGEILTAEDVREEKSATSLGVDTRKYDFSDQKSFDESVVGKAARKAVESVIKLIDKDAKRIPWQAKVVIMRDGQVYINSGAASGVKIGEVFHVYRPGQKLIDPDTGLDLGSIDEKVGVIKVTDNTVGDGKASICEVVSGEGFKKGDLVKDK